MTLQKIYVSKYALSSGIIEVDAEVETTTIFKKGIKAYDHKNYRGFYNDDFWLTKEEAITNAEAKRKKKITSLKKQIQKLEKLTWQ